MKNNQPVWVSIPNDNIIERFTVHIIDEEFTFIRTDEGYYKRESSNTLDLWTKITLEQYKIAQLFIETTV